VPDQAGLVLALAALVLAGCAGGVPQAPTTTDGTPPPTTTGSPPPKPADVHISDGGDMSFGEKGHWEWGVPAANFTRFAVELRVVPANGAPADDTLCAHAELMSDGRPVTAAGSAPGGPACASVNAYGAATCLLCYDGADKKVPTGNWTLDFGAQAGSVASFTLAVDVTY
jgi:hypothetical protein